jgi:hypothetical protein
MIMINHSRELGYLMREVRTVKSLGRRKGP